MSIFSADSPPVFLDITLALEQIGDAQAMQGMLSMLEESLARDVPLIAELLAQDDVKGANRLLHAMKGFIPIFCVDALCAHVAAVELMSKTGTAREVRVAYELLMPDLDQLQSEVVGYLNEQGAAY
jgi:HPt (histidine-containing phosphotransfer) domain-containing protein